MIKMTNPDKAGNVGDGVKNLHKYPLVCKTKDGFYPIEPAPKNVTEKKWAEDNGKLNDHIIEIEDINGVSLWKRI